MNHTGDRYSLRQLLPDLDQYKATRQPLYAIPHAPPTFEEIVRAGLALKRLSPRRCDERSEWIRVLCTLIAWGPIGKELAREWSRQSPKFNEEDFERVWDSLSPDGGITIATLHFMADEDDANRENNFVIPAPATSRTHSYRNYTIADAWLHQKGVKKAWGGWLLAGNITLIGGVPNVGKSPLLFDIERAYLEGTWPDGTPVPDDVKGRNVLHCFPEGYIEQSRVHDDWGLSNENKARIFVFSTPTPGAPDVPNFVTKLDGANAEHFSTQCDEIEPGLIIMDGLRAAMTGDESSSADVDRFIAPLISIATRHNAIVILSHHLTKGSETASRDGATPSQDWFRGSGHIVAACRSAWIVDRPNPNDKEYRRITLVKAAAGPQGQEMGFRMGDPALGLHFVSDPFIPPLRTKQGEAEQFILHALADAPQSWESIIQQAEATDISEKTFVLARGTLKDKGRIKSVRVDGHYLWSRTAAPAF